MWQVIHYTQSSKHVRQHAGVRQHRAHPSVMPLHDCSGFPPHLLPHLNFSNFCPPSQGRKRLVPGRRVVASSQAGPSGLSVPEVMPGASPPIPLHHHYPPPIYHMPTCVFLTPSSSSLMGNDTSGSYGEMQGMLLLKGEGMTCPVAKD